MGLFPRTYLGTFWEGRLLQLLVGRGNKPPETLQGCCSELCPSVMENQIFWELRGVAEFAASSELREGHSKQEKGY